MKFKAFGEIDLKLLSGNHYRIIRHSDLEIVGEMELM